MVDENGVREAVGREYSVDELIEDVTADGERLLLNVPTIPSSTYGFRIVVNWPGLLKQSDPR